MAGGRFKKACAPRASLLVYSERGSRLGEPIAPAPTPPSPWDQVLEPEQYGVLSGVAVDAESRLFVATTDPDERVGMGMGIPPPCPPHQPSLAPFQAFRLIGRLSAGPVIHVPVSTGNRGKGKRGAGA